MTKARTLATLLVGAVALSGCTMMDGYGGLSVGYGDGYHDPYYDDGYYPASYYGWYDDYYYPGTGYYVYWEARRAAIRDRRELRENWSEYRRERRADRRDERRDWNRDRREEWRERRDDRREGREGAKEDRRERRGVSGSSQSNPAIEAARRAWRVDGPGAREERREERREARREPAPALRPEVQQYDAPAPSELRSDTVPQ
jgi:hypothetical protein